MQQQKQCICIGVLSCNPGTVYVDLPHWFILLLTIDIVRLIFAECATHFCVKFLTDAEKRGANLDILKLLLLLKILWHKTCVSVEGPPD